MSGHIGRQTKNQCGQVLGRITGLDPANLYFEQVPAKMLSKEDAKLVDVIHTNGGDFMTGDYGTAQAIGTVDFYPNGGEYMPGCEHDSLSQKKYDHPTGKSLPVFDAKSMGTSTKLSSHDCLWILLCGFHQTCSRSGLFPSYTLHILR